MSYHIGIGFGVASRGPTPCEPHITCNGCGLERSVRGRGFGMAATWFLDGKAAPGWALKREGEHLTVRRDLCPKCKGKPVEPVEVVRFPAKCSRCGEPMVRIEKLSGASWVECPTCGVPPRG